MMNELRRVVEWFHFADALNFANFVEQIMDGLAPEFDALVPREVSVKMPLVATLFQSGRNLRSSFFALLKDRGDGKLARQKFGFVGNEIEYQGRPCVASQ